MRTVTMYQTDDGVTHNSIEVLKRHLESSIASKFSNTFEKLDGMTYTEKMLYIQANFDAFKEVMGIYEELVEAIEEYRAY